MFDYKPKPLDANDFLAQREVVCEPEEPARDNHEQDVGFENIKSDERSSRGDDPEPVDAVRAAKYRRSKDDRKV